jgi:hypothetical protein
MRALVWRMIDRDLAGVMGRDYPTSYDQTSEYCCLIDDYALHSLHSGSSCPTSTGHHTSSEAGLSLLYLTVRNPTCVLLAKTRSDEKLKLNIGFHQNLYRASSEDTSHHARKITTDGM